MAKAGDEYQELVGVVAKALDPGFSVKTGQWIKGPDGRRDLDVEVRGTLDGAARFILIECKDWRRPVGINVIDAIDSKRHDIHADRAIVYSNSGFSKPALKKAARIGIGAASALKAGDPKVKVSIRKEIVAKRLSVDTMRVKQLHVAGEATDELEEGWDVYRLRFDDKPVINWISGLSRRLLTKNEDAKSITFRCTFHRSSKWSYGKRIVRIDGIELSFLCSKSWLSQVVKSDVTLGLYDYLRGTVTVPDQQTYFSGLIDRGAWVETDRRWDESDSKPGTFELYITLLNYIPPGSTSATPNIDGLIADQEVLVE